MCPTQNTCATESESTNKKPPIDSEEDRPFEDDETSTQDIPALIQLNEQKHSHAVDDFKNTTGKHILYACLFIIVAAAVADAKWHIDSSVFASAFDVAKVVATTILGYFFGSKSK